MKNYKARESIAELLEFPKDIMLDTSKIVMLGNLQIFIENHKGIIEYTDKKMRVNTRFGVIEIEGEKLHLKSISADEIAIKGKIVSLIFSN
ncbi:MAG: sporulation protein YqfC [Alkaliphilus sp.]